MPTNTDNINAIAQAVKDRNTQQRSRTTYASILTDAQDFIVEQLECLIKINSSGVVLVGGTQEYDLPVDFIKFPIESADEKAGQVSLGTNGKFPLRPTTTDLLDLHEANWRAATAGIPIYFYLLEEDRGKIGFHPKPSSAFVTDNGSTCRMKYVYRADDISDNSNQPFNNSNRLRGLQFLLKLHAIWQINIEDKEYAAADKLMMQITARLELAREVVGGILSIPGQKGFDPDFRTGG